MMKDHVALPARVERNRTKTRKLARDLLAGVLSLASFSAYGIEDSRPGLPAASSSPQIILPPIPYLDTMPWLTWAPAGRSMKVDTLLLPGLSPSGIDFRPAENGRSTPALS